VTAHLATDKINVAVITGQHVYDVPGFHILLRGLSDMDVYIQSLEDWVADEGQVRSAYDVVLFYNCHQPTPEADALEALGSLGQTKQGIVVLHHALLAHPQWPVWSEIVGVPDRSLRGYYPGEQLHVEVAEAEHPITRSLFAWDMVDEIYDMVGAPDGSQALLTTRHPRSMATLAWTRLFGQAKVFCMALGHDSQSLLHPTFRLILSRGIRWTADKL